MKKFALIILLIGQLALATKIYSQNIAINGTGSSPDTSAMLDISSTNKGFLTPRMTTAQQNAIPLPALGLLIFNTTDNVFNVNTGTPSVPLWTRLAFSGSGIISVNGLTGNTQTFAAGNSGSDFDITSSGTAHTFNLPTASLTKRGALSSADWSTFNNKKNNADSIGILGYTTLYQLNKTRDSLQTNIALKANKATTITINGTTQDLSANRTFNVGTLTGTDTAYLHNKTTEKLQISDTANMRLRPIAGTNTTITGVYPNLTFNSSNGGGTVTSASVTAGNGFAGSVANAGTTPAITITTSVNGMVKGNGTALSAATAGTDYLVPNSAITGASNTKITYDPKGLVTAGAAALLASADFANQGTTTTILHGNASGNPAFGSIVNADITSVDAGKITTGLLSLARGGTNTDLSTGAADGDLLIGTTTGFSRLPDVASGNSLISGGSGSPSWGKIGLSTHVAGTLPVSNGGTGTTTTTQGGIVFGASGSALGTTAAGASGQVLQSAGTGTPVWSTTTYPATSGPAGNYLRSDGTNIVSSSISPFAPNTRQLTPADATGTTNSTGVMMGFGALITPVKSGAILIIISGDIQATGSNSLGKVQIRYGTGTAPANGAALTGTTAGGAPGWNGPSNNISGFSTNAVVTSLVLSPATAYWIDLSLSAGSTQTSVKNVSISIVEL